MTSPGQEQAEQVDPERMGCSESTMLIVRERQLTEAMRQAGVYQGAALEARALAADLQGRLQKASEEWGVASGSWLTAQAEYEEKIAEQAARINGLLEQAEADAGHAAVVDGEVVEPEPVEQAKPRKRSA